MCPIEAIGSPLGRGSLLPNHTGIDLHPDCHWRLFAPQREKQVDACAVVRRRFKRGIVALALVGKGLGQVAMYESSAESRVIGLVSPTPVHMEQRTAQQ